jgi:hypothetical protein
MELGIALFGHPSSAPAALQPLLTQQLSSAVPSALAEPVATLDLWYYMSSYHR